MVKSNIPIYICIESKKCKFSIQNKQEHTNHTIGKLNEHIVFIPNKIDSETINPKNFLTLKEKYDLKELLIIDRIHGAKKVISIADHINKSGLNFLRSKTPEGDFPQFPDMSKIYNNIDGFDKSIVHTIGPKRFENQQAHDKIIYSEHVGLIAPVAHYVGIKISALGSKNIKDIIEKL